MQQKTEVQYNSSAAGNRQKQLHCNSLLSTAAVLRPSGITTKGSPLWPNSENLSFELIVFRNMTPSSRYILKNCRVSDPIRKLHEWAEAAVTQ